MMRKLHILILAYDRQGPFGALLTDVFFSKSTRQQIADSFSPDEHANATNAIAWTVFFSSFTDSCNQIKYRHWD